MKSARPVSIFHFLFIRHRGETLLALGALLLLYWFSLPRPLFQDPTCMVLEARDGQLLGARIARDGQWRFPYDEDVPEKFRIAVVEFEDKRFFYHPGIDPGAFGRALGQNLRNKRVVSGGSTITMQVIRLARKGKSRTVFEKLVEMILATRLEISFSKKEILALYASYAPFGGNVVGLNAASWRYFGKSPHNLSWAESATLAVLPNSPSLIHPGRNRSRLQEKRDRLLSRLFNKGIIDRTSYELALEEPLPEKPHPLPRRASHLLERAYSEHFKNNPDAITRLRTTIDPNLQNSVNEIARRRLTGLKNNEIHNLAILVLEVKSGNVLAYTGNAPGTGAEHSEDVDIITAARSTGSIMKPLLYAMMLQEGKILPGSLIPDVPTQLGNFRPENYLETFDGVVPARMAVARSLNVPFVRMLQQFGLEKFHYNLKKMGVSTLRKPPAHYGLTLILGGAEASLWDLSGIYCSMARTLREFYPNNGAYKLTGFRPANYLFREDDANSAPRKLVKEPPILSADATWFAFGAMEELERPTSEGDWERFESGKPIAWKTGTSFGFRDAWSIGVTPEYVVGVWVGNADGEGRPGLIGVYTAAPVMFDVFDQLPSSKWFDPPYDAMKKVVVCKKSGYLALDLCEKDTVWGPANAVNVPPCPYHQLILMDKTGRWRVTSRCENPADMVKTPWFVLPPVEEFYFKNNNPNYAPLPLFKTGCDEGMEDGSRPMQLIYPKFFSKIYVPLDLDGLPGRTVFKIAHRNPSATIHWHLDRQYIGSTTNFHEMALNPPKGKHLLTVVDEKGERLEQAFEILIKNKRQE